MADDEESGDGEGEDSALTLLAIGVVGFLVLRELLKADAPRPVPVQAAGTLETTYTCGICGRAIPCAHWRIV